MKSISRRNLIRAGIAAPFLLPTWAKAIVPQRRVLLGSSKGSGGGPPGPPPTGFQYLKGADGDFLKGTDGKFLLGAVGA